MRGHWFKVRGRRFRGDVRKRFFYPEGGEGLECAVWVVGRGGFASHPLKSIWMSTWHIITFRDMDQALAGGIRWEFRCS